MANKKHITTRDLEMINFLEKHNLIITAELAAQFFYLSKTGKKKSALVIAQRRLAVCHELGQLKRFRDHIDQKYIYYVNKKPTKVDHRLMITEFIINLSKKYDVTDINVEYKSLEKFYEVRPDIYITFLYNQKKVALFVECENTKKFSSEEKYKKIFEDKQKQKNIHLFPYPTWTVCVSKHKPETEGLFLIWIKNDFSNFDAIQNELINKFK